MRGMQSPYQRKDKTGQTVRYAAGYGRSADPVEDGGDDSMCVKEEPYILCDECGGRIHKETEEYEQDDCCEIDGFRICGACVMRSLRRNHYVRLKEDARC